MILPIVAYGDPVLKKRAEEIDTDYPGLKELIANMYETMYASSGVGLAAPQIGLSIRLFITDGSPFDDEDDPEVKDFKKVFINPVIEKEEGSKWVFNEGCLSIPGVREDIERKRVVHVSYLDQDFIPRKEVFKGLSARILQHEYDHLEGVLFTDHLSAFKKRLLKNRLLDISKGKVDVQYRMKFPLKNK